SASLPMSTPRSEGDIADHAGKALRAAATARSMSAGFASATFASSELSCGLSTSMVPPSSASTNSLLMKSCVWKLGLFIGTPDEQPGSTRVLPGPGKWTEQRLPAVRGDRERLQFAFRVFLLQPRCAVLQHHQHRAL